jgi:hypothetical protein
LNSNRSRFPKDWVSFYAHRHHPFDAGRSLHSKCRRFASKRRRSAITSSRSGQPGATCPRLVTAEIPGDAAYPGHSQHRPSGENMAAAKIQLSPEEWKKIEGAG